MGRNEGEKKRKKKRFITTGSMGKVKTTSCQGYKGMCQKGVG